MKLRTRIYKLKDAVEQVDVSSAWSIGTFKCYSCQKSFTGEKLTTEIGDLCVSCVETELRKTIKNVDLSMWPISQFMTALEALGNLRSRLTVLWRFHEILKIVTQKSPSDVDQLKKLLVRNLGYINEHPLAQPVRQAAFQACTTIGEPLIPLLISMCEPTPWQFYANVIMTLGNINPDHPEARTLIEKALQDNNPEIHKRAQVALGKQKDAESPESAAPAPVIKSVTKKTTKQELLQAVLKKLDPAVRDLVTIGAQPKQAPVKTLQSIQIHSPAEKMMEDLVSSLYTIDALRKIYRCYLHDIFFTEANIEFKGRFSINKLKKTDIARALAKVYANKSLFQAFFEKLPQKIKEILQFLVWEGEEYDTEQLESLFGVKIVDPPKNYRYGNPAQDIDEQYTFFQIRSQYDWRRFNEYSYRYYISLSDQLRTAFKHYLPSPDGYDLIPLETIDRTDFLFENRDQILTQMKLYYSYIDQGNLKFSKSTGKLLKSSLTQMARYCSIEEFYGSKDKELQYFRTKLIIDFLQGTHYEPFLQPAESLQQIFHDFFRSHSPKNLKLYQFLYHLKGNYYEYHYEEREKKVKDSLLQLLQALSPSQWVSFENIMKYCLYREIFLDVTERRGYGSELYFNRKYEGTFRPNYERTYARDRYYKDAVVIPFLKTMMFLFASFGILDLAYNYPENHFLQERTLKYLSPFDSLQYVRLTPLGAYLIGLVPKYDVTIEEEIANIIPDDKRLILTIEGHDPVKAMVLDKIADRISENCYKVNYHSFLKECATKKEIKQKIALFQEYVTNKPPPIWQEFLDDVLNKINPLVIKQQMSVFKLKQNKELISLVARDEILKQYVLKAEDYHILIASTDIPKVKKRLEEFGYFIDNI